MCSSPSGYLSNRTEDRDLKKYLHTHDHSGIIHKSQKAEVTQKSINGWTDKRNVR